MKSEPACLVSPWFGLLPGISGKKEVSVIAEPNSKYRTQWYFKDSFLDANYPGFNSKSSEGGWRTGCVIITSKSMKRKDQVNSIRISRSGTEEGKILPQSLKRLGFNFSMSYNEITKMLTSAGCPYKVKRQPTVDERYGFMAELQVQQQYGGKPYLVQLSFQACNILLTKETDENTLISLAFMTHPPIYY